MNPLHATHTASLILTSFGAGIGLVTGAILLNVVLEGLRRLKRGPNRPAVLSDPDMRHFVQATRPARPTGESGHMPMLTLRRYE